MTETDVYRTLSEASPEVIYKDKKSKFLGYAFPVSTEDDIKEHLDALRSQHKSAGHVCYAWQLGKDSNVIKYRVNDDGEPSHSAGTPIYHQIQSYNLTEVLVVVVRYFGGIKLGVSGLIQAYKQTASMVLEKSVLVENTVMVHFEVIFDYTHLDVIMRLVKEKHLLVVHQEMHMNGKLVVAVRKKESAAFPKYLSPYPEIRFREVSGP